MNLERLEKVDNYDLLSMKIEKYRKCRERFKDNVKTCDMCIYKRECESLLKSYGGW